MKTVMISLKSIDDVKGFVSEVSKVPFDVDLSSGRYVVDAKSIMGIFSLDLSNPIKVEIHCQNDSECAGFVEKLAAFGA